MRTRKKPKAPIRPPSRRGPQSVGRIVAILEYLVGNPRGASLSELATQLGAPITSLVGLCDGLVDEQCLQRDQSGRYVIARRVHMLAARAATGPELVEVARPILARLVRDTDETTVLGVLAPDADLVVYLDKIESPNPIRYAVGVGERRELHCTAIGKVFLAHFPPDRLDEYLSTRPLTRFTSRTLTDPGALRAQLERIRREGVAYNLGERVVDANGMAAPVFGTNGSVVAGILLAGPAHRMEPKQGRIRRLITRAASDLTQALGGGSSPQLNRRRRPVAPPQRGAIVQR